MSESKEKPANDYCPKCDELGDWKETKMLCDKVILVYSCVECSRDYFVNYVIEDKTLDAESLA